MQGSGGGGGGGSNGTAALSAHARATGIFSPTLTAGEAAEVASALGVTAGARGDGRLRGGGGSAPVIDVHTHILPESWPSLRSRYGYGGFVQMERIESGAAEPGGSGAGGACGMPSTEASAAHASSSAAAAASLSAAAPAPNSAFRRPTRQRARMYSDDGAPFREVDERCWSVAARLADADARGVDVQVLSTVPALFSYFARPADGLDLAMMLNDHCARAVAAAPTRLVGLATLPMQAPELAAAELARCVRTLGLRGAQIGSRVNGWTLAEPALDPVWRAAEELGAAIFVHPWGGLMAGDALPRYWLPWLVGMPAETTQAICCMLFAGVFDRFPRLRVLFAHGGGAFPYTIGRIQHGFDVRPDLCAVDSTTPPRAQLGRFWADSLVHDERALALAVDVFGEDRVCLGTDYPFVLGETTAASRGDTYAAGALIDACALPALVKHKLRSANALAWLGMDAADFSR